MSGFEASSGGGRTVAFDQVEQKAKAVGELLRRALPSDGQEQADLREVIATLAALHVQLIEWVELHRLIHDLLAALAPFHALLTSVGASALGVAERQALLQSWRPCQRCADELADFAEEIEYIGRPFRQNGHELEGGQWVVGVVAFQTLVEGALKEEDLDPGSLLELVEELDSACHRHLAVADRGLRTAVGEVQRLTTNLLGGLG
jgi:hypothetical protein